ncbi:MAG: SulP family inorganic anion transporter [Planctomycetales bacterium]|nr:SulP family inorganic anion transporter [Planctomycetales bacterium]
MTKSAKMRTADRPTVTGAAQSIGGLLSAPRQDLLASIVVFLVALPLCMGIAIASGVPVAAGLVTGIVGGLVVGWLAGAPLQVSGPAAGLTVIVYELVQQHGLEVLGLAVLVGGVLQLVAGVLRLGQWFRAVSPAVIHGMLAGIGVLIFSSQFHVMVDDQPKGSGIDNLTSIPAAIAKGMPIPELRPPEARAERKRLLMQIGALHDEQVQLRELAAERVPATLEQGDHTQLAGITQLVERQQALVERLIDFVAETEEHVELQGGAEIQTAAVQALQQSQIAVVELQQGDAPQIAASQSAAQSSLESVFSTLKNHDWAAKVGILAILVLVGWKVLPWQRLRRIPAPLVAVVAVTIVAALFDLPVLYVEVPDNLWSEVHFPTFVVLQSAPLGAVVQAGVVLAVVASAETLLCATAVEKMRPGLSTNYDRELAAQGVGNIVCGLFGALPMTGVIVRSSANVDSGGQTRLSAILHGLWLLVFVSLLAYVIRMIPTAGLAAILVYTGFKLVNVRAIRELRRYGRSEVAICLATIVMIVATDLLTGVLTGIALSAAKLLYTFSHLDTELDVASTGRRATLRLAGAATFIRLPRLAACLDRVPDNVQLHVDFERLNYIDHACLDLLMNWAKGHEASGGSLVIDWDSLHANFHGDGPPPATNARGNKTQGYASHSKAKQQRVTG